MGDRRSYLINQIVKYSQKLDDKGFGANHDGNLSVKFEAGFLATPTAMSKGDIISDLVIQLDHQGKKTEGIGNVFSEIKLHLSAYSARPDTNAVIHAHPPFATARGLAGKELRPILPEAIVSIGDIIPVVPFAMPGAPENDSLITDALLKADVFMVAGNGVLAIGDDLEQAYLRLELVEHLAKIDFYAQQMGVPMQLSFDQVNQLLEKRQSIGLGPKARGITQSPSSSLEQLIAEEIKKVLKTSRS